ncbi:MAG TPA: 16S rRNA (cytidine(1402)-2'-O)-methyltransferase [Gaiellaceae bacterium]|nr:16S rRNA (cytidine(1402)-2'-O)-methyltransferase [Gaiellaceae bacterium]
MLAVCATPIGNLEDVTLRVLAVLRDVDIVLAEDTRHTRGLLERHDIRATLLSYHEHNEAARTAELVPRLLAGEQMALVSDAGLPGISDPGLRLIQAAHEAGVEVTVLPGPSAVETALVASGLGADRYAFVGFLPRRGGELAALWQETAVWGMPIVAFESPKRVGKALASLAEFDPQRAVAVCRELTKRFEEVVRGTAAELSVLFGDDVRGEITVVVDAPAAALARDDDARDAVRELMAAGASHRSAVDVVARLTDMSKKDLYDATL